MGCCFSKKRKKREKEPVPLIVKKDTSKFPENTEPTQCEDVTVPASKLRSSASAKGCRELPMTDPTQHENMSVPALKAKNSGSAKEYQDWLPTEPTQYDRCDCYSCIKSQKFCINKRLSRMAGENATIISRNNRKDSKL
ncbi:hypothetical protein M3Y97_00762000 [Aphelenchoides bicaudatus]|nr:hypothetical protein M3Y97_00762000 [Aphelenchoides bicaudatus]